MQDPAGTIVIGVITGLLTASVLLILKSLFMNSFLPWYRQTIFRGLDISGNWYAVGRTQKIVLELRQSCERLSGKATVQLRADSFDRDRTDLHIDDIRTFEVTGQLSERFVSLQLKHTDPKRLGVVTFLLQVQGDGTKLEGQGSWYTPLSERIVCGSRMFYRDEARALQTERPQTPPIEIEGDEAAEDDTIANGNKIPPQAPMG